MGIYKKTILIISMTFVLLIVIILPLSYLIVGNRFITLENREQHNNIGRVLDAISNECADLGTLSADWAMWDDTYYYMQDRNETYINSNYSDSTFDNLGLNIMLLVDNDGNIIYSKSYDREKGEELPLPQEMKRYIYKSSPILETSDPRHRIVGFLPFPESPLIFASSPIVMTDGQGRIRGNLIFARYLNNSELEKISKLLRFPLEMHTVNEKSLPNDFSAAFSTLSEKSPILVKPASAQTINSYGLISDIYGNPLAVIRINMQREIFAQGSTAIFYLALSLVLAGIVNGFVIYILIKNILLKRLKVFNGKVESIAVSGDFTTRVSLSGNDEISGLASEFNRMMDSIEKARIAAKSADIAKSQFLANMSHEIRTPMNVIIGMTDLVSESPLDEKQHEMIETIKESANMLLSIINDILDFSKIEANEMKVENLNVEIDKLVNGISSFFTLKLQEKNLKLNVDIDGNTPDIIKSDPIRLRQILLNLVGNAIKFTQSGGVNIRIKPESRSDGQQSLLFEITDTGIGFSEDVKNRLFNPFVQADGSTSRKYGGTGLGLVISKRLVELLGGEIFADSIEGKGSSFRFYIPLIPVDNITEAAENNVAPEPISDEADVSVHNGMSNDSFRILVADDNRANQNLLVALLGKYNFKADVISNGKEAVQSYMEGNYDLILMDCQMPEMDGFEATAEIRRLEKHMNKKVIIIAITANAMQGDEEKCLISGMDDYLSKPVKKEILLEKLKKWLS